MQFFQKRSCVIVLVWPSMPISTPLCQVGALYRKALLESNLLAIKEWTRYFNRGRYIFSDFQCTFFAHICKLNTHGILILFGYSWEGSQMGRGCSVRSRTGVDNRSSMGGR